ncbi:ribosome recycling factor, partial [Candidatus Pelagibacter communis]|uniref:ribosome recycling factor n=1 Tax=Pelagibacter ubique TaxID=198252 RepID=UPI003CC7F509
MDKAIEVFSKELSSLRTGRANASMLDLIKVDVYGQQMPINQIGSITTPEPRMINIQVWDTKSKIIKLFLLFIKLMALVILSEPTCL